MHDETRLYLVDLVAKDRERLIRLAARQYAKADATTAEATAAYRVIQDLTGQPVRVSE